MAAGRPAGAVGSSGRARQPTALDVVPTRPRGLAPDTWPPGQPLRPADLTPPQQEATAQMDSDTLLCVTPHAPNPLATGSPGQSPPPPPCGKDSHSRLYGSLLSLAPLLPSRAALSAPPFRGLGTQQPALGLQPCPPHPCSPPPCALTGHSVLPPRTRPSAPLGPVCTAGSRDTWPSGAPTACPVVSVSPAPSSAATQHWAGVTVLSRGFVPVVKMQGTEGTPTLGGHASHTTSIQMLAKLTNCTRLLPPNATNAPSGPRQARL